MISAIIVIMFITWLLLPFLFLSTDTCVLFYSVMPSPYQCIVIPESVNAMCTGLNLGPTFIVPRSLPPPTLVPHSVIDFPEPHSVFSSVR